MSVIQHRDVRILELRLYLGVLGPFHSAERFRKVVEGAEGDLVKDFWPELPYSGAEQLLLGVVQFDYFFPILVHIKNSIHLIEVFILTAKTRSHPQIAISALQSSTERDSFHDALSDA